MTQNNLEFRPASSRLKPGAYVALLPNRALPIAAAAVSEFAVPGLRGLLAALDVAKSPAELRAVGAGQSAPPGHFFVALELCYWQVEMGGARWMAYGIALNLSPPERSEITAALAELFATSDAKLIAHPNGELSLLCESATPAVKAAFPDEALGCELKSMLPTPSVWQRYLNEAQMVLANLPVNLARAARGEPVVNSVWFWGAEAVVSDCAPVAIAYFGDDPILQALSSPAVADAVQVHDYRALLGAELAEAVAQLPRAAKLWLPDGRVFQGQNSPGFVRGLWQKIIAKVQGGRT